MSLIQATEVMCDECCYWIRVDDGPREANRIARKEGWQVRQLRQPNGLRHYCPECVERRKAGEVEPWKEAADE